MITTYHRLCIGAVLIVSFLSGSINAQKLLDLEKSYKPKIAIKHSPFHLIYLFPSVQFAIEHKVFRNVTFQYDVGLIFNYNDNNRNGQDYLNKRGYRLIGEVRYYLPFTPRVPFYVAAEGYYHNINFGRYGTVEYYDNRGNTAYYQYLRYTVRTEQNGAGFKFGMLLYPGGRNNRFFFDINAGLAARHITYTNENLPLGPYQFYETRNEKFFDPDESDHNEVRPILGIRLGYKIR